MRWYVMARTSRRYEIQKEEISKSVYRAGVYVRLSSERHEEWREKSSSPKAQAYICEEHAKSKGIQVIQVYEDYEYSGTNFERPAYIQMMSDVRNGKINCIIVRDLSRLGREHIEMGQLIDKVFPFLGVRFISVTDNLDTIDGLDNNKSFEVMLKNIINDMYAKDISSKIISVKHTRAKEGYFIGSVPPYGYKIEKTPKGQKLVINEDTAPIVRKIFDWTFEGKSQYEVTLELNRLRIATATHYHKTGEIYRPEDGQEWSKGTVAETATNETYTGTLIQGKRRQSLVKGESQHSTSPEDWIVVKNAHEAIISDEEFQQIQKIRRERKDNHYFASERNDLVRDPENRYLGLVFLKDTERALYRRTRIYGKNEKRLLYCFQPDNFTGKSLEKVNIFITEENLDAMVLQTIQGIASQLISEKSFLEKIKNEFLRRKEVAETGLKELSMKKDLSEAAIARLYERYATGSLDKAKYITFKEDESRKHASYCSEISRLEMMISNLKKDERKSRKVARTIFQARKETKLSAEVIKELIERIDVISKTEIEIHFLYDFSENGGI